MWSTDRQAIKPNRLHTNVYQENKRNYREKNWLSIGSYFVNVSHVTDQEGKVFQVIVIVEDKKKK